MRTALTHTQPEALVKGLLVQPMMLYQPSKIAAVGRRCLQRKLAIVVVGFPAVPLMTARTRLCISAAHTRKDIDHALEVRPSTCHVSCTLRGRIEEYPVELYLRRVLYVSESGLFNGYWHWLLVAIWLQILASPYPLR